MNANNFSSPSCRVMTDVGEMGFDLNGTSSEASVQSTFIDEEGYINEEDRIQLQKMSEFKREAILAARFEARERQLESERIHQKVRAAQGEERQRRRKQPQQSQQPKQPKQPQQPQLPKQPKQPQLPLPQPQQRLPQPQPSLGWGGYPRVRTPSPEPLSAEDEEVDDSMACQVCRNTGKAELMLLCEACDREYHTFCLSPPLASVPEGEWYCPHCSELRRTDLLFINRAQVTVFWEKYGWCEGEVRGVRREPGGMASAARVTHLVHYEWNDESWHCVTDAIRVGDARLLEVDEHGTRLLKQLDVTFLGSARLRIWHSQGQGVEPGWCSGVVVDVRQLRDGRVFHRVAYSPSEERWHQLSGLKHSVLRADESDSPNNMPGNGYVACQQRAQNQSQTPTGSKRRHIAIESSSDESSDEPLSLRSQPERRAGGGKAGGGKAGGGKSAVGRPNNQRAGIASRGEAFGTATAEPTTMRSFPDGQQRPEAPGGRKSTPIPPEGLIKLGQSHRPIGLSREAEARSGLLPTRSGELHPTRSGELRTVGRGGLASAGRGGLRARPERPRALLLAAPPRGGAGALAPKDGLGLFGCVPRLILNGRGVWRHSQRSDTFLVSTREGVWSVREGISALDVENMVRGGAGEQVELGGRLLLWAPGERPGLKLEPADRVGDPHDRASDALPLGTTDWSTHHSLRWVKVPLLLSIADPHELPPPRGLQIRGVPTGGQAASFLGTYALLADEAKPPLYPRGAPAWQHTSDPSKWLAWVEFRTGDGGRAGAWFAQARKRMGTPYGWLKLLVERESLPHLSSSTWEMGGSSEPSAVGGWQRVPSIECVDVDLTAEQWALAALAQCVQREEQQPAAGLARREDWRPREEQQPAAGLARREGWRPREERQPKEGWAREGRQPPSSHTVSLAHRMAPEGQWRQLASTLPSSHQPPPLGTERRWHDSWRQHEGQR